jgi:hypothetical protein
LHLIWRAGRVGDRRASNAIKKDINHMSDQQPQASQSHLTVFDLGKQKRRDVKKLRRGEGKLVDVIKDSLDELRASGADVSGPVVFICERKAQRSRFGIV